MPAPRSAPGAEGTTSRHPSYHPRYCRQIVEFYRRPCYDPCQPYTVGNTVLTKSPRDPMFIVDFAVALGVYVDDLDDWAAKHREFGKALRTAKALIARQLVTNAALNLYEQRVCIFALRNVAGWTDTVELTGQGGAPLTIGLYKFTAPSAPASSDPGAQSPALALPASLPQSYKRIAVEVAKAGSSEDES